MTELIGWASSIVLLATLMRQVFVQWRSGAIGGVSKWLFIGQMLASIGFLTYSLLLNNWVFVASNLAILIVALVGEILYARNRRRATRAPVTERS
jgi:MtN3 and saliva related transmembrane protein